MAQGDMIGLIILIKPAWWLTLIVSRQHFLLFSDLSIIVPRSYDHGLV